MTGHAIELRLNAYLLLKGVTVDELRSGALGRDVKKLTSKAFKLVLDVPKVHRLSMDIANEAILDRYIETRARMVLLPEGLSAIC